MKMTKQVVKIFTADQIKDWALETVINEFLKENPDHKIILTDYSWNGKDAGSMFEERALIVFEVSDSTSTGGRKKSKPKPKPSGKKPKREPTDWKADANKIAQSVSGESWARGQKPYGRSWADPQRIRQ